MKSYFKKSSNILKNDGIGVLLRRLVRYSAVRFKRVFLRKYRQADPRWSSLKGKFEGQRIFVVGNGPSLNETELYLLKNEYTMCFNRINLLLERLRWKPNFFVMTDDLLVKDNAEEVVNDIIPNVDFAFFPDIHPSNVSFKNRIGEHQNVYYLNTDKPKFSVDLPKCRYQ